MSNNAVSPNWMVLAFSTLLGVVSSPSVGFNEKVRSLESRKTTHHPITLPLGKRGLGLKESLEEIDSSVLENVSSINNLLEKFPNSTTNLQGLEEEMMQLFINTCREYAKSVRSYLDAFDEDDSAVMYAKIQDVLDDINEKIDDLELRHFILPNDIEFQQIIRDLQA